MLPAASRRPIYEFYRQRTIVLDNWRLPETDLRNVITAFHKQGEWNSSIPAMVELLQSSPQDSTNVRLKLAQILVQKQQRPAQAWNVFSKVDPNAIHGSQQEHYLKLKRAIEKARAENPYDFVDADW